MIEVDPDPLIERLLQVRGSRVPKQVEMTELEIKGLIYRTREIFMSQSTLVEIEAISSLHLWNGQNPVQFLQIVDEFFRPDAKCSYSSVVHINPERPILRNVCCFPFCCCFFQRTVERGTRQNLWCPAAIYVLKEIPNCL